MKKLVGVGRILLGLVFVVFGANHIWPFMSQPEGAPEAAARFSEALGATGYMWPLVGLTQLVGGLCMWPRRWVPIGLILLAPVTVNIFLFHLRLDPALEHAFVGYTLFALHALLVLAYMPAFQRLWLLRSLD